MAEFNFGSYDEKNFESILQNSLPEPPPDEVIYAVTPWRRAMRQIIIGVMLNMLTLDIWVLNNLLPAAGLVYLILGLRTLRRENGWFKVGLGVCIVKLLWYLPMLIWEATIHESLFSVFQTETIMMSIAANFMLIFCIWRALIAVKQKANLPPTAGSAMALMLWYAVLICLAYLKAQGIIVIAMVGVYLLIIRSLFRLSGELDEAGYAIAAAPVRIENRTVVAIILAISLVGMAAAYMLEGGYPMAWEVYSQTDENADIKAQLRRIGFPSDILEDLLTEDILACKDAKRLYYKVTHHPETEGLQTTQIAVELAGDNEEWRMFYHFRWAEGAKFYGTEAIALWPPDDTARIWGKAGETSVPPQIK